MKLAASKKTNSDHGNQTNEDSVYKQITETFGDQITPMLNIPKDEESFHFSFRGMQKCGTMAARIAAKSDAVKTISEVLRASIYLGVSIMFHLLYKNPPEDVSCYFDQIAEADRFAYQAQLVDKCSQLIAKYYDSYESGIIDSEKLKDKTFKLVNQLPKPLQDAAQNQATQLLNGVPLSRISSTKGRGRPVEMVEK